MKVLDRCGSMYRDVQPTNNSHSGGAATEGTRNDSDLIVASCGDKQEKNGLTCIVTANGNDTATVKLDIRFSAGQKRGRTHSHSHSRKKRQNVSRENSSGSLVDRICSSIMPNTLVFDVGTPLQAAERPAVCGLFLACE